MISALLYDRDKKELRVIDKTVKDLIAVYSEDESRIDRCSSALEVFELLEQRDIQDFACLDIGGDNGIRIAESVRERYRDAGILIIADISISPKKYIKPSVMAGALILRPCTQEEIRYTLEEFICSYIRKTEDFDEQYFLLETKKGIVRLPYDRIYCFEANMKRVLVRLKREEYSYYDTLETLGTILPEQFWRCHRSYIINSNLVREYNSVMNAVVMEDGSQIPISRNYRKVIREKMRCLG